MPQIKPIVNRRSPGFESDSKHINDRICLACGISWGQHTAELNECPLYEDGSGYSTYSVMQTFVESNGII